MSEARRSRAEPKTLAIIWDIPYTNVMEIRLGIRRGNPIKIIPALYAMRAKRDINNALFSYALIH